MSRPIGAGTWSRDRLLQTVSWSGGAGRPGYRDGPLPVAAGPRGLGGRANQGPAAASAARTRAPGREDAAAEPGGAASASAAVAVQEPSPASRAWTAWPDPRRERRSAARSLRRGGRGRHWRAAAAGTGGSSADARPAAP